MKDATLKELGPGSLTTKQSQLLQSCNESLWKVFEPRVFKQPWAEISQRFQRNLSGTLAPMDRALVATDDTEYSAAMPPDVRRWLCPAVEMPFTFLGYALVAAFSP
jgi:hypothetical protein